MRRNYRTLFIIAAVGIAGTHYCPDSSAQPVYPAQSIQQPQSVQQPQSIQQPYVVQTEEFAGFPAPAPAIKIEELQNIAVANHPQLAAQQYRIRAAQGGWVQSGLYANPEVSLSSSEMGNEKDWGQQELTINQEIVSQQKRNRNRAVSQQEWDSEKTRLAIEELAVRNEIRIRAYEVLAAQKILALRGELLRISEEAVAASERLHSAKESSLIDLLQTRAQKNAAVLAQKTAVNLENAAWERLRLGLGVADFPPRTIDFPLETVPQEIDADQAWSRIVALNPQLQLSSNQAQLARAVLQREKAAGKPNLSVNSGFGYDNTTNNSYGIVGVSVPLQLYNRNQGSIAKASADLAAALRQIEADRLQLHEQFTAIFNQHQNAKQSVDDYQKHILPDMKQAFELCIKGYKQGEYSYLELLTAQQTYFEAQQQYIENLKELAIATALIDGFLVRK